MSSNSLLWYHYYKVVDPLQVLCNRNSSHFLLFERVKTKKKEKKRGEEVVESKMAQARQRMKYKNVLVAFMGYRDGTVYAKDTNFTDDELESITSDDLCEYFLFHAYGSPHPQPEDFPTLCRSSSLHFYKKAISSFMPNSHHVYDVRILSVIQLDLLLLTI
jgi:hypothetical protein